VAIKGQSKCLTCNIVSQFVKSEDAWICPHCKREYPFRLWMIGVQRDTRGDERRPTDYRYAAGVE
jgi:hypothetical protein